MRRTTEHNNKAEHGGPVGHTRTLPHRRVRFHGINLLHHRGFRHQQQAGWMNLSQYFLSQQFK